MRPIMAAILGGGVALAVLARLFLPDGTFLSGAIIGATAALVVWVWDEPPEMIARWRRGAEGERATARALRPLQAGWYVDHDLAARNGNLDHVVVGRGGVFLLDSKNLTGRLEVEDGVLNVRFEKSPLNDYAFPRPVPAVHGAARHLRERLHEKLGWIVDVYPVVVLVTDRFEQGVVPDRRLTYVALRELPSWLEAQPDRIAEADLPHVVAAVDALPPAGEIPVRARLRLGLGMEEPPLSGRSRCGRRAGRPRGEAGPHPHPGGVTRWATLRP